MIRTLLSGALLIINGSTALAADSRGNYKVMASRSCDDVVKEIESKDGSSIDKTEFFVLEALVAGYLTEFNNLTPDTINIAPDAVTGVLPFVHDYCRAHPSKNIYDALESFTKDAYPNRQH